MTFSARPQRSDQVLVYDVKEDKIADGPHMLTVCPFLPFSNLSCVFAISFSSRELSMPVV